jgi:hypothetical protein
MQDFDSMVDLIDEVQDLVERQVQGMRRVSASDLGLDNRCGRAYVDADCIVVDEANARSFNYYGGFEYIDECDVRKLGDYVVYLATADRVMEALECLMEKDGLCESEDAE